MSLPFFMPPAVAELLAHLEPTPAAYLKAARQLDASGLRPIRAGVLSTFTAQFLAPFVQVEGARRGFALTPWFAPWGHLEEQALDPASELFAQQPDAIIVLARIEEMLPAVATSFLALSDDERHAQLATLESRLRALIEAVRRHSTARLLIANFAPPPRLAAGLADAAQIFSEAAFIQRANDALAAVCRAVPDVAVLDYARLVAEHGTRAWVDPKLFHLARLPFGVTAQIALSKLIARTLRAAFVVPAKVLALDLDHTLWGGILGEDGLGGIKLGDEYPGNVFKAFQRYLATLAARGVLLAICSKNNEADVDEVFARHGDMILRREDFAAVRINWQPKSANLRELAAKLNLGLDSFVFFDDSPFEREEVRAALPMVTVLDVPESPLDYIECVEQSGAFDRLSLSDEDRRRTALYREQSARAVAEQQAGSMEDFLRSLGLIATIGTVDADTLPRVAQLLAKTNQFNLTVRRHSAADVQAMLERGAIALWLRLADRFGDHGLVGVAIALPGENGAWRIDSFLLSCRVIGRGVETAFLSRLATLARERGATGIVGEYLPAPKNSLVAEFFPQQGFAPAGERTWHLDLTTGELKTPPHIALA